MFTFLIIIIAIIAVLMVLVVLLQSGQGGGLAGIAAGGATTQILGARQAPDMLEKATWVLATAFFVLCILTNFAIPHAEQQRSIIQERAAGQTATPTLPPAGAPATTPPAGQTTAPAPNGGTQSAPSSAQPVTPAP
ncbi:MAG TPA: preprotein translocase subunit SecG [Rhodothermales bacterium]|nr:preprotein translocase subunit SecG [Rhodothermales bacterium]